MLRLLRTNPRHNPEFTAEAHQRLGRRVAMMSKLMADKVARLLPAGSPLLSHGDDTYLAALGMAIEMTGQQLTAANIVRAARLWDSFAEDEVAGAFADQDPVVIAAEKIQLMLMGG